MRRCHELLTQYPDGHGGDRKGDQVAGNHNLMSRRCVARDVGMSDHQYRTAMAVGNVLAEDFEAAVEGDNPPTVTTLATAWETVRGSTASR